MIGQAVGALANDPTVFARGIDLVTVQPDGDHSLRVVPIQHEAILAEHLSRTARWTAGNRRTDPPKRLCENVIRRGHWQGVRELIGVTDAPYITRGGGVVTEAGYNAGTQMLLNPAPSLANLDVPYMPRQADAQAAADRLLDLVAEFPFEADTDRAAWLAGLLTMVGRPAIDGPTPGLAITANKAGVGKTLLVDAVSLIARGRPAPTEAYTGSDTEMRKVILSIARSAAPIVFFDNVADGGTYGGSALDAAMTSTVLEGRILGTSNRVGEIPLRPVWWATGNSISPAGDAHRRWLPIRLRTNLERPETRRSYKIEDLVKYIKGDRDVPSHRGALLRDALLVLKWHASVGYRPGEEVGPLGRFEDWSRVVRRPVLALTKADPCGGMQDAAENAPQHADQLALLNAWRRIPGGETERLTARQATDFAGSSQGWRSAIDDYLTEHGRGGRPLTSRELGYRLRGILNKPLDGFRLAKRDHGNKHETYWAVEPVPQAEAGRTTESTETTEAA